MVGMVKAMKEWIEKNENFIQNFVNNGIIIQYVKKLNEDHERGMYNCYVGFENNNIITDYAVWDLVENCCDITIFGKKSLVAFYMSVSICDDSKFVKLHLDELLKKLLDGTLDKMEFNPSLVKDFEWEKSLKPQY